jgi:hypothetical protein
MQLDRVVVVVERTRYGQRVQIQSAVREHHAFGSACAAAGGKEFGDLIFIELAQFGALDPST